MDAEQGRSKRETWREWCDFGAFGRDQFPDPELITREALLLQVERWKVPGATARNLRHWEDAGLLPRATLEGPPGEQRAMYPWWAVELVTRLRRFQGEGISTARLGARLRAEAHRFSHDRSPWGGSISGR